MGRVGNTVPTGFVRKGAESTTDMPNATSLSPLETVTLVLRVLMEVGIVAGLAYWGVQAGSGTGESILLGLATPAIAFGFWGAVDFHQAGRLAEPLRLVQELVVSGLAAVALYAAGRHAAAVALAALSVVYHALVYLSGGALLKRPHAAS
jgi:Protein of unknown function (DUF2568)